MDKVDLNCDMGESFGNYTCGMDGDIAEYISSANAACGFHAGDPLVMEKTVSLCKDKGVAIGAHPGFPDLVGFGRRQLQTSPAELRSMVMYQVGALKTFCEAEGIKLQHVKPHGAMYNMAAKDEKLAHAIAEGIYEVDPGLTLLGLANSFLISAAKETGLKAANEVFADRAYNSDGTLVKRGLEGAVITDENIAISRVLQMVKKGTVVAIDGKEIEVCADSVCLHGDGKKAVLFAKELREHLEAEGVEVVHF